MKSGLYLRRMVASALVCLTPSSLATPFDPAVDSAWMTSRSYYFVDGDASFMQDLLVAMKPRPFIGPRMKTFSPRYETENFSFQWAMLLNEYYRITGDTEFVQEFVPGLLDIQFSYFAKLETSSNLVGNTNLVNWPEDLRDQIDYVAVESSENAVTNAFYVASLEAAAELCDALSVKNHYGARARSVREAYGAHLTDPSTGLFKDAVDSTRLSYASNVIALSLGLAHPDQYPAIIDLIRTRQLDCPSFLKPYVTEACFVAGDRDLGLRLAARLNEEGSDTRFLLANYVLGLESESPGWSALHVSPKIPTALRTVAFRVDTLAGRMSARYEPGRGLTLIVAPGTRISIDPDEGDEVMVKSRRSHARGELDTQQRSILEEAGWREHTGISKAVWISVDEQMLRLIENNEVVYQARCATAEKGTGSQMNSLQTPLGWHSIVKKIGGEAPWGQVFKARVPTKTVWQPGDDVREDLVLTRVLLLSGEEPGVNKGGNVDSFARNIYIHGTNDEGRIGVPSSHGCVRMLNDDVIEFFELVGEGAKVLITEMVDE